MTTIIRPGQRIVNIPGIGLSVSQGRATLHAGGGVGWWTVAGKTCVAAYQPKGAASLATSYTNLANPGTYDAAPGVAPTLDADGWNISSGQYLLSGAVPTSQASSMLVQFSNGPSAGYSTICGVEIPYTAAVGLSGCWGGSNSIYWNGTDGVWLYKSPQLLAGNLGYAGLYAYRDGVAESGSFTPGWAGTFTSIKIGGSSVGGGAAWTGSIQAYALYSDILTSGEMATTKAAMAAL